MLTRSLEEARKGQIRYAAVVTCENGMHVDIVQAGSTGCEFAANFGFDLLKQNMIGNRQPSTSSRLGPDYVRYDISRAPLGWDFASWLMDQEMSRVRAGAPAPLKVAFVGDVSRRKWGPEEARWVEKVMRPLIALLGAVEDPLAAQAGVNREFYMLKYVTEASRRGEAIPRFRVDDTGPSHDYVTITLREAEYWPHRNSNMEAWSKLAHELRRRGENVVFVRDIDKAVEQFEDFITLPEAATDINARAKLYANAKANLFVANGPWHLALFGNRPWLMFCAVDPDDPFDANKPNIWRDFHGVPVGEQFPWSRPDQRIIWKADDYDTMMQAWCELEPALAQAKAA